MLVTGFTHKPLNETITMSWQQIKKLNEQRGETLAEMRGLLKKAETENRDLSAEESEKFDDLSGTAERFKTQAERHQQLYDLERADGQGGDPEDKEQRQGPNHRGNPGRYDLDGRDEQRGDRNQPEERREQAFDSYLRYGLASMEEEQRALLQTDAVLLGGKTRAVSRGNEVWGTRGFQSELIKSLRDFAGVLEAGARTITTGTGNEIGMLTVDDTDNEGSDEKAEGSEAADDVDPTFGNAKLGAFTYDSGVVLVPFELLQDSEVDIAAEILDLASERIGVKLNRRTTAGSGVGQPQGFLTAAGVGKTAALTSALTYEELLDFFHSVPAPYRKRGGVWQLNDQTLAAVRKLKDGDGRYIFAAGTAGEPNVLMNKPYVVNPDMPDIAAGAKPLAFGDFTRYRVRFVANPFVRRLEEAYATKRSVGFYVAQRADGRLTDPRAIKSFAMATS